MLCAKLYMHAHGGMCTPVGGLGCGCIHLCDGHGCMCVCMNGQEGKTGKPLGTLILPRKQFSESNLA